MAFLNSKYLCATNFLSELNIHISKLFPLSRFQILYKPQPVG